MWRVCACVCAHARACVGWAWLGWAAFALRFLTRRTCCCACALQPLAARVAGRILCLHGGLGAGLVTIDQIRALQRRPLPTSAVLKRLRCLPTTVSGFVFRGSGLCGWAGGRAVGEVGEVGEVGRAEHGRWSWPGKQTWSVYLRRRRTVGIRAGRCRSHTTARRRTICCSWTSSGATRQIVPRAAMPSRPPPTHSTGHVHQPP